MRNGVPIYAPTFLRCLVTAVATVCLCSGCSRDVIREESSEYLAFCSNAPTTKAGAGHISTDSDDKLRKIPFGVYGYKSVTESGSQTNVFVGSAAQEVGWDGSRNCWTYSPKRKWEMSMHYRFRAYWPYTAEINPASDANRIGIEYKSTTEQYDLLVAYATRYPLTDEAGISAVPLNFKHALAGLRLKVRFKRSGIVESKTTDYVTRLYLNGMYTVGTMIYGQASSDDAVDRIKWLISENTFDDTSELFGWTGKEEFCLAPSITDDKEATVFDNDKVIFVIPQTLSASTDRPTYVNFYTEKGGEALHTVLLPETKLEPGKIHTFTLVIHSTYMTVNVDIQDWNTVQSNVDINL